MLVGALERLDLNGRAPEYQEAWNMKRVTMGKNNKQSHSNCGSTKNEVLTQQGYDESHINLAELAG